MRRVNTTGAVLLTLLLSLALVAYVFTGNSGVRSDKEPHCTSKQALDQVKAELFRRAAAKLKLDAGAFSHIADNTMIRTTSRIYRRHYRGSDSITCSGPIALELPPGVLAAGDGVNISSGIDYELEPGTGANARLLTLSRADALEVRLARLFKSEIEGRQPIATVPSPGSPKDTAVATNERLPERAQPNRLPGASRPATSPAPKPNPGPAGQPEEPVVSQSPSGPESPEPPPAPKPSVVAVTSTPPAVPKSTLGGGIFTQPTQPRSAPSGGNLAPRALPVAGPSVKCRHARTKSEIALCTNDSLASLDRQMSSQFSGAFSAARPGQRVMLERTRRRFLRYRDSCKSEACIADAYRRRIQEISAIMAGPW